MLLFVVDDTVANMQNECAGNMTEAQAMKCHFETHNIFSNSTGLTIDHSGWDESFQAEQMIEICLNICTIKLQQIDVTSIT